MKLAMAMVSAPLAAIIYLVFLAIGTSAFAPVLRPVGRINSISTENVAAGYRPLNRPRCASANDDAAECWNPALRKQLAALSSLGLAETAYLTYDKLTLGEGGRSAVGALCAGSSPAGASCSDVLHGPYASVGGVPLSVLGMAAYAAVLGLAALPLLAKPRDDAGSVDGGTVDGDNRIGLLAGTTLMASFSVYLMWLLAGVLHASCPFCFLSAGISIAMAGLCWTGGALPEEEGEGAEPRKRGIVAGASSVGVATVAALGLFLSADPPAPSSPAPSTSSSGGTLLASAGGIPRMDNRPPPITAPSSREALALASDLGSLDARMFGAFWCSHCYDQKQALGREAMRSIPYVECDGEGYNSRRGLCKEREVPGYPTWEIGGELFPGERSLDELREIVDDIMKDKKI